MGMADDELADAHAAVDAFRDTLESTETVDVPGGPMADPADDHPSSGMVNVDMPAVLDVSGREDASVAGLGRVYVVEVTLDISKDQYRDRNALDTGPWPQYSPAEAIYQLMDDAGIERPDGTPDLGVQYGGIGGAESHTIVQGYIPLDGGAAATDGGVASALVVPTGMTLGAFLAFLGSAGVVGMARLLTDVGEEYTVTTDIGLNNLDVGVYDDASAGATGDAVSDTTALPLSTEPSTGNYVRQTENVVTADISGNWGVWTDTDTVFDMTNTSGPVDSWFVEFNFASTDTGTTADHLLCTGALSQEYDLSNLTQLTITANGVGWTVD